MILPLSLADCSLRDTDALVEAYGKLLPWIPSHPNVALINSAGKCTRCGSEDVTEYGVTCTGQSKFRQLRCQRCGSWVRETRRVAGSDLREIA